MHYLCSQRKDYSNSLTLYVPPDITSRTFHTCHGWTWGLCSLDFIQCLLHDPCFRHSGVRLESLGALYGCLVWLLWHLQASEAEGRQHWVLESPTCSTSSSDSQGKPSGCLLLGLVWNWIVLGEEGLCFLASDHFRVTAALMFSMQGFIPAVWMPHYQVEVCFKRRKWDFSGKMLFSFFLK